MNSEALLSLVRKNPVSVVCGLVSLILVGLIYFRLDAIPAAEAELALKQAESERLATNVKYAAQLKEQLEALVEANKDIDTRIIRENQRGVNTQYFYKLESDTGVKLVDFRPLEARAPAKGSKTMLMPVGFNLSVQGSYPQVLDFLRQLEGGARYSRVLTASISGSVTNRAGPLTLSLTVELLGLP
jgi:hypothetical protein